MKHRKQALAKSLLAIFCCLAMLVGATFAWFTDSVTSSRNIIATGTLDVELYHSNGAVKNEPVDENTKLFLDVEGNPILWEPGVVSYENLRIVNEGSLALVYQLAINATNENYIIDGSNRYGLSQVLKVAVVKGGIDATDRAGVINAVPASAWTSLASFQREGSLLAEGAETWGIAIYWQPTASDNLWNANDDRPLSSGDALSIDLGVHLTATQMVHENDSFGNDYDVSAKDDIFPSFGGGTAGTPVEVGANGLTTSEVEISIGGITATIPAGVKVKDGITALTLSIKEMESSKANVVLGENEALRSLDVHVEGVAADNTTPIIVTLPEAAPVGLNLGNYKLYHVENGVTNEMTLVASGADFSAHNQFKYDPATGDMVLYMATFSEVAVVADTENAWEGEFDYSWYTYAVAPMNGESVTEYTIANADQLAAFGAIVGGMAEGIERDSFSGKTVKLIADINLGDKESENNPDLIFYPIGYNSSDKKYEKTGVAVTTGFYNFSGTFDGNGHTISNFYHNTWEMKGDHNWYDATLQYYRDGMGLFGKVYGGTIKNLTVSNFSSDGEIATTGVIAAYADGATFENIAITNCNPRVYNIGNGGIVGCVGWYAKEANLKTTFKNITVDNSNKISALWGSYDVPCGGIVGQYYPTSGQTSAGKPANGGISFENCHVSAIMDVNNDVCGNYQYYAYRYAGMLIGSVSENVTVDGHVYPKMDGITAEDCTVHFGTWNDYYYCEFEKNGHPSYSGPDDYKFSRIPHSEINFEDSNGNGIIDTVDERNSVNGCKHTHTTAEDNQCVYLQFNNLVTGNGWGVTTKKVGELDGVTILDRTVGDSVEKFKSEVTELANKKEYKLGDIFTFVDKGVKLVPGALTVAITNKAENNPVSATIVYDRENWENGTITLTGTGEITITIQDYYFCTPTTITVNVTDRQPEEKFVVVMNNGDFLHRVGNSGTVALDKLFKAKDGVSVGTVSVTVEAVNGTSASGTYSNNAIKFNGTGVVKVTIKDDDSYCIPTELSLEVVDAENVTTATNAKDKNVVLLNDAGFSSLEVSNGYTLYGNGFTLTCGSDSAALDFGYSFVTLSDGILDNVQIVTPNYDFAALYKSQLTSGDNRSQTTDKTRYYNAKSGVMVSGNSQILNSRISGARAAVNVTGGNCLIDNSRIELGAVASLLVGSANGLTLRDVTLVQKPTASTYDPSKVLMGFSVLFLCDADGNAAPVTLEGTLVQNAWIDESSKVYVPSSGQQLISEVMEKTNYKHDLDGDNTKESLNLGFAYMPEDLGGKVKAPTVTDVRTNSGEIPYERVELSTVLGTAYVYSYKNTNGTADSFKNVSEYEPNKYSDIITVNYADTTDGLENGKSFGNDGWVFELNVDLDKASGYKLDFSKLAMNVNGVNITDYKVNGSAKPTSPVAVIAGGVTYTLTATIDGKEYTATFKVTGTETSKESPSKISGPTTAGFGVAKSYGGDWSGAADVLTGVKIKYWSVAENKYVEFDFSSSNFTVPGNAGKLNGTNSYWEYTHTNNDFTLKVTNTVAIHSGKSVYGMPIRGTDGKLYFTISSTNGYVGSGTTSRAVTMQYEFTDNNGGDKLTFTHTFNISYDKDNQYSYSDLSGSGKLTKLESSSGGSSGGTCLAEGTLITLADGSKTAIENLRKGDYVMSFDHLTGKVTSNKVIIVVKTQSDFYKNTFVFDDGTQLVTINEHGIYDLDLQKYVNIDHENYAEYIGHNFVSIDTKGNIGAKKLVNVISEWTTGYKYDIVTDQTLNYVAEDTLSVTHVLVDVINSFDFDENMMYDQAKMQADIEKYGLYTYDEWAEYCDISVFEEYNIPVMKVGISKGLYTKEYIISLINTFVLDESVQII